MSKKMRGNKLEEWEVSIIKCMLSTGRWANDQDILAYFSRPTRSINHRNIGEIRSGKKHQDVRIASSEELDSFLLSWRDADPETGLSLRGDELLIKAREAMISAVHTFNSAGLLFRAELYVVTAIIAWTYLMHSYYKKRGIEYRYFKNIGGKRSVVTTENGAEKYLDLSACLKNPKCPLPRGVKDNLEFLLELRNEIEHRSTNRLDEAVSAKLQACCLNFNTTIKEMFGVQFSLERQLPIALQFVTFSHDQKATLKKFSNLPRNIELMMTGFDEKLSPEQQSDPSYAYRVYMVSKTANRSSGADLAVEIVPPGSDMEGKINTVLKEVEKRKYLPSEIVDAIKAEGWDLFSIVKHTELWKRLEAKKPGKGFGAIAVGKTWCWYDSWLKLVRNECEKNPHLYRTGGV